MHWLAHILGLDNPSGPAYLAWSGFVGDLPMFGAFLIVARRFNCHRPGCWRVGLHHHDGRTYVTCRRHKET